MKTNRYIIFVLLLVLITGSLLGCSRDPNVRKRKYLESGNRYFEKHQYREAGIQYSNAVQVDGRYADAHYQLARTYLAMHAYGNAYTELRRTVELAPDNIQAKLDLADLLIASRNFPDGEEQIQQVIDKQPDNVQARNLLANLRSLQGNYELAVQEVQKAIAIAPNQPDGYITLSFIQQKMNQTAAAEESLKKATTLDPKSTQAWSSLGRLCLAQHRVAEAEQAFLKAIDADPKSSAVYTQLAALYMNEKQLDKGEQVSLRGKEALTDEAQGYQILGEYFITTKQMQKAVEEYRDILKRFPKDDAARQNYIQALLNTGQTGEAEKYIAKLVKDSNNKSVVAMIGNAQLMLSNGKVADAIATLDQAVKAEPENALAHYYLGIARNQNGEFQRAEAELRESVRLNPFNNAAQLALAQIAVSKGDLDLLQSTAEQMMRLEPLSDRGFVYRGMVAIGRRNYAEAEAFLKRATEVAPNDALPYTRMGRLRELQNRPADAEKLYEEALAKDADATEAMQGLLGIYLRQKQPDRAIASIQAQIAKAPKNGQYLYLLGATYYDLKKYPEAEASLTKSIELDKFNTEAFYLLGRTQVFEDAKDRAIATSNIWITNNPRDVRAYVLLGSLENQNGNPQHAQELYKKALEIQPDNALAANNLANLMLAQGQNKDMALTLAQTARRQMPDSPVTADTLAWAYYNKGTYGLAIELLEGAVKQSPQDATMHYHLGMCYQKAGKTAKAKQHLDRALLLDPKLPEAAEIKKTLTENSSGS
jgi:tetratricopeptide (TPR) repeat protein